MGSKLIFGGANRFRSYQGGSLDAKGWKHSNKQYYHSHSSQPVGHVPPEKERLVYSLDIVQGCGSSGGEAAHGLKKAVCIGWKDF